jgi:hypothetical protein
MFRVVAIAALLALPALSVAQAQDAQTGKTPQRIRDITVTKGQPCPKAEGDEVVVCHTLDEPYRIPKPLRDEKPIPAKNQSWVNRSEAMDQVGREAAGLPDTCSPVGSGGQTGCAMKAARDYAADKREKQRQQDDVPQ